MNLIVAKNSKAPSRLPCLKCAQSCLHSSDLFSFLAISPELLGPSQTTPFTSLCNCAPVLVPPHPVLLNFTPRPKLHSDVTFRELSRSPLLTPTAFTTLFCIIACVRCSAGQPHLSRTHEARLSRPTRERAHSTDGSTRFPTE